MARARSFGLTAKSVFFAIGVHLIVALMIGVSITMFSDARIGGKRAEPKAEPVQATVVPEQAIEERAARLAAEAERKKREELERQRRVAELERKRKEEEARLAALERERERKEQEAREAEQRRKEEEAKRVAAEEKRKEAERQQRIAEEKREKEERRLAEEERMAEERRVAEQKRLEAQRERELAEQRRREEEEMQRRRMEREARDQRLAQLELSRFTGAIKQKVSRNWIKPSGSRQNLSAVVAVTVSPTGEVISAEVLESSGDPIFDRSVQNAVFKSSPLPFPSNRAYYEHIREFKFEFVPNETTLS